MGSWPTNSFADVVISGHRSPLKPVAYKGAPGSESRTGPRLVSPAAGSLPLIVPGMLSANSEWQITSLV